VKLYAAALLAFFFAPVPTNHGATIDAPQLPCAYDDKVCAWKVAQAHPVFTRKYWQASFDKPLEERIGAASPELIEFLHLGTILHSGDERPRSVQADADFVREVREVLAELPDAIKAPLSRKLAGVYFAEDLYGSAWSDYVFDEKKRRVGGVIALDVAKLRTQTANAWATWKENTPFAADPRFRLSARIASDAEDNRKNAIRYILLHELGHVFSADLPVHPSWNLPPSAIRSTERFAYFNETWLVAKKENRYATVFDETVFPQRRDVVYYGKPKLAADQMIPVYDNLGKTNLPTLYAATLPGDDFAEAFATYVHTVLAGKPYSIEIYRDGALAKTYTACWSEPRCSQKRAILERLLGVTP
jgi:hypothetical protein